MCSPYKNRGTQEQRLSYLLENTCVSAISPVFIYCSLSRYTTVGLRISTALLVATGEPDSIPPGQSARDKRRQNACLLGERHHLVVALLWVDILVSQACIKMVKAGAFVSVVQAMHAKHTVCSRAQNNWDEQFYNHCRQFPTNDYACKG